MKTTCFIIVLFFFLPSIYVAGQRANEIDSLEQAVLLTPDDESKVKVYIRLSDIYSNTDFQKSYAHAYEALKLSKSLGFKKGIVLSHIELAKLLKVRNELKPAFRHADTAKKIADEEQFLNKYAEALIIISNFYVEMGEYQKTADLCFEALKVFEQTGNQNGVCIALHYIGGNYYMQKEYEEAEKYLTKSINLSREHNYLRGLSVGLANMASLYKDRGETQKAIEYYYNASKLFKQLNDLINEGICYSNIAINYLELDNIDSAFKYYHLGMDANKNIQNNRNLAVSYNVAAQCYAHNKDTASFLKYAKQALKVANANGLKNLELQTTTTLHEFYASIGVFDSAYKYGRLQYITSDSLNKQNSLARLSELEMIYEIEKEERERKVKEERRELFTGIIFFSLLAGIIILLILLSRYRIKVRLSKLKQQKLKDDLHYKQKEITTNVMSLMKKNEMLTDINERLIEIREKAISEETKNAISNIGVEIENNTQEKIWEEFEIRFKQVHADFYSNLIKQYPDLSPNEIRLCAFLKLNLSTKEISSITGQSPRSLEVARYRLRKKMGITSSPVNLTTFISQI